MKAGKSLPPFKNWPKVAPQIVCATSASWAMLCIGLVRGWSSSAIPQLLAHKNETIHLDQETAAWITALPPLCASVGSLLISLPMQMFGRRLTLMGISVPFVVGFYMMGLSHYIDNIAVLICGRVITGLLTGASAPTAQIYVSECSSPRVRGALGSFTATFLSLGILVAYIIGAVVEWQILCFIIGSLPIVLGLAMVFMPETPSWLMSRNLEPEARNALQKLRGKHTDIEGELERIRACRDQNAQTKQLSYARVLTNRVLLKPLVVSMSLMFFQQFSGINAVIFYSASIFEEAGSSIDRSVSSIIIGIVQLVCTMASALLVDRFGRRFLLFISGAFMSISLTGLAVYLYLKKGWESRIELDPDFTMPQLGWIPLLCLILFVVAFSAGFGAVPQLVMGEIFPVQYRHQLSTIAVSVNLISGFAVVRTFPTLAHSLTLPGIYGLYASCSVCAVIVVALFLPETKGKTLEEIDRLFNKDEDVEVKALEPLSTPN